MIITNYVDVVKFDNLLSLCTPYDIIQLNLNEICEIDTLEAYFSVPEEYNLGKEKRKLYVFSNPTPEFLTIIVSHTEIKFIIILNGDVAMAESEAVKSAKQVTLHSTKTGVFSPDFDADKWETDVIESFATKSITDVAKTIDEAYLAATTFYLLFASGKNTEIRDKVSKLTTHMRKILIPKIEQFIHAYYSVDIVIAGNGARMRNPGEGEKDGDEKETEKESEKENTSPVTDKIEAKSAPPKEVTPIIQAPKKEAKPPSKKNNSKKAGAKNNSDIIAPALEYDDSLEPMVAEQQADLINQIREIEEKKTQSNSKIPPNKDPVPKVPIQSNAEGKLHPPPNVQSNNPNQSVENQHIENPTHPLAGLHPPACAKSISEPAMVKTEIEAKAKPNQSIFNPNIPNPIPKLEKKADQKYSAWKNEFDLLSGLDKNIFRVFCQVLSEYRSCVGNPAYCEEAVTPEQIYIELRAGKWSAGVPSEFTNKWLYLHTLNQLKSKPQSADTEFDDITRQMNKISEKLGFVEKPECAMVREKVKVRIAKGFTKKDPIPDVLKKPIVIEQPAPKRIAPKDEESVQPPTESIFKQPSSKIPSVDSGPHQEVVDAIRHVKLVMKSGDIEDFAAYGRALQKILEFIGGK